MEEGLQMVAEDITDSPESLPIDAASPETIDSKEVEAAQSKSEIEQQLQLDAETDAIQSLCAVKKRAKSAESTHPLAREIYWRPEQDPVTIVPDQVAGALKENDQALASAAELLSKDLGSASLETAAPVLTEVSDLVDQARTQLETLSATLDAALEQTRHQERTVFWQFSVPESVKQLMPEVQSHLTLDEARDRIQQQIGQTQQRLDGVTATLTSKALSLLRLTPRSTRALQQELSQLDEEHASVLRLIQERETHMAPFKETEQRILNAYKEKDVQNKQVGELATKVETTTDLLLERQASAISETIKSTRSWRRWSLFGLPTKEAPSTTELVAYRAQYDALQAAGFVVRADQELLSRFESLSERAQQQSQVQAVMKRVQESLPELVARLRADWKQPQQLELLQILNRLANYGQLREEALSLVRPLANEFIDIVARPINQTADPKKQDPQHFSAAWESLISLGLYGETQEATEAQAAIGARFTRSLSRFRPGQVPSQREPRFIEALEGKVLAEYLRPYDASTQKRLSQMVEPAVQSVLDEYGIAAKPFLTALGEGTSGFESIGVHSQLVFESNLAKLKKLEDSHPGIGRFLCEDVGIFDVSRYPSEVLVDQFESRSNRDQPYIQILNARADYNGAFRGAGALGSVQRLYDQAKALGYGVRVLDVSGKQEALRRLHRQQRSYGSPAMTIIGGHGSPDSIAFGDRYVEKVTIADLTSDRFGTLDARLLLGDTVILNSCKTGMETSGETSIGRVFAERTGLIVLAPDRSPYGLDISLSRSSETGALTARAEYGGAAQTKRFEPTLERQV